MQTLNDVHQQFADFFAEESLRPYAYLVSRKLSEGHICLHLDEVENEIEELPLRYKEKMADKNHLQNEPIIALANEEKQPFILHNNRLYLQRYFNYETIILNRIKEFLKIEESQKAERLQLLARHKEFIIGLFKNKHDGNSQTDWQIAGCISAALNNFTIITGGPGTGKTTTVAKILAILFNINPELKVALAAPTGKAASRMAESLKGAELNVEKNILQKFRALEPLTIQRLLKFVYRSPYFKHNKNNPLNYDVVIVDESSMLDVALFAKLMDAIGPKTRLILLGDKDQLASVEAGSLFGDLCQAQEKLNLFSQEKVALINSFIANPKNWVSENNISENNTHPLFEHIIELRFSHRYSGEKGIGKFSKAVIQNEGNAIKSFLENKDEQVFIDTHYSEKILNRFLNGYKNFIVEKDIKTALHKLNKLRILCAVREGEHGLKAVNQKIEKWLQQNNLLKITGVFYENRPVIITQNYYDLNLFNGDIGIIRPDEKGELKAWFENSSGEVKSFSPTFLTQCETVFAMTIHKSQGSEFDEVLVVLPNSPDVPILTRELLYTAVTRARSKVFIQGNEKVILQSAKAFVNRASGIKERFLEN